MLTSEETTFTLDNMGRFLCNTLQEALDSSAIQVAGKKRSFDTIVIGGGTFVAAIAASLLFSDASHSRRILVLEAGPFALPEHSQNMPYQGGTPDFRKPWDSHPALAYPGLLFAIGGRSLAWGGWSPQMLAAEISSWPASVAADLVNSYFQISSDQIGATDSNDFIFGRLHDALRQQLFAAMKNAASVPGAIPLSALPDHPAVRYYPQSATLAAAAGASGGTVTTVPAPSSPPDIQLREWRGLDPSDTTPRADLLNLLKLEAPLAVQARTAPGEFPNNKYSAVPTLTKAARITAGETGGIGTEADARKRLMVVPKCHVLDIITETQNDNWVQATGVRVKDATGTEQVISLTQPNTDGRQGSIIVALGTIESTRLAPSTFKDSLAGRAAQRMGTNLVAHLRSNLTIRIPIGALSFLASDLKSLAVSALFVKGKSTVNGVDHFSHLQITASGLGKLGDNSEVELFQKVPDIEHLEGLLNATDTHVVITLRGIGEMTTHNPDSFIRLSSTVTDFGRPAAEVTMADVRDGSSTTPQSETDKKVWDAMDALADQVAVAFANKQPFDVLANDGTTINMPANTTAAQVKAAYPYAGRRDRLGTTHHDAGTLFMGTDAATSVTNEFGRIHDTTNCYVASPAIFPALGSPNPMLTGVALSRRTSDMLTASVLPQPLARVIDPGFTALLMARQVRLIPGRVRTRKWARLCSHRWRDRNVRIGGLRSALLRSRYLQRFHPAPAIQGIRRERELRRLRPFRRSAARSIASHRRTDGRRRRRQAKEPRLDCRPLRFRDPDRRPRPRGRDEGLLCPQAGTRRPVQESHRRDL
jgi:choline dehydrogenase-like flavoprotein